jgi:hypothetical protein
MRLIGITKMRVNILLLFIGIWLSDLSVKSQEINFSGSISWKPVKSIVDPDLGITRYLLNFDHVAYSTDHSISYYEGLVKLNASSNLYYQVSFTQTYFEEVPNDEIIALSHIQIDDTIKISYTIAQDRKIPYLRYTFVPLRKNPGNGKVERLKFFSIKILPVGFSLKSAKAVSLFSEQSVFSTGVWHKLGVKNSGVYQISFNDLKNIGITDPDQVRIYGNGGKMLSEVYTGNVPDDPEEIPIMVMTDYILFYAEGPVTWSYNNVKKLFDHHKHQFSDYSYYYITNSPGGKRISPAVIPTDESNFQVNTFDGMDCHEENLNNLIKSGRSWFGENFSSSNSSQNFSFNFPNLVTTDTVKFEAEVVGRSSSVNAFYFLQNNQSIGSVSIPSVNVGNDLDTYGNIVFYNNVFKAGSDNITIRVSFDNSGNSIAQGWLGYLNIMVRQNLAMNSSSQLAFRDVQSVGSGNIGLFNVSNAGANIQVWDVTDIHNVTQMSGDILNNTYSFKANASELHNYVAFNSQTVFLKPVILSEIVPNQNLHGLQNIDLVIVSHPDFLTQAQALAGLHYQHDGLSTAVVTPDQVYNEFSSGMPDPASIRNFMKMLYNKASGPAEMPKYLLLFGDGSYDNKTPISSTTKNSNYIITYQSANSLSPSYSYVSDDYFGLLDDNENISTGILDIGIGRLPVQTSEQADNMVTKIRQYIDHKNFGDWRNELCIIADDEEGNMFMRDADKLATKISQDYPAINVEKIYLDAYQQVSTSTGQRYPDVKLAILKQLNRGALIVNYMGHGGEELLSEEQVVKLDDINQWQNQLYPLFITATCEFGRYDNYKLTTGGEAVLLNPNGGGIGLLTTTRVVYQDLNYELNLNFYINAFIKTDDNPVFRFGDIVRKTKNSSSNDINKLCFTLLGDPALSLAYPAANSVVTDSINHKPAGIADTLNAYEYVTICGHATDTAGQLNNNFNGILYPTIFDKAQKITTLANDNGTPFEFNAQNNILFRGQATIKNGLFTFNFILPRDIDYNFGLGKIDYYAHDSVSDLSGYFNKVAIGGMTTNPDASIDNTGPAINLYMNDTTFKNGGITDEYPTLLARVSDANGINPGGNGIGHDILATIDGEGYVLNSYFQTDLDNYRKGNVEFKLPKVSPGLHTVTFKIWDIFNNSSQSQLNFVVQNNSHLTIQNVFNYPNPLTDNTTFFFEHNQNSTDLDVTIEIFNMSGSKVKVLKTQISSSGYTSGPIQWDGKDGNGNKIRQGVYIYRIILRSIAGTVFSKSQKLIVIN